MEAFFDILMLLGSSVCHQIAERSYTFGDYQMPLCARCLGIHVGFLASAALLWSGALRQASGLPRVRDLVLLCAVMSVAVADALLSYSGISPSDNLRRSLSGLCLGVALPFILFPLMNTVLFPGRDPRGLISRPLDWLRPAAAYAVGAAAILAAPSSLALFAAVSAAGIVGLFLTFSCGIMTILSLALERRHIAPRWLALVSLAVAASALLASALFHNTFLPDV